MHKLGSRDALTRLGLVTAAPAAAGGALYSGFGDRNYSPEERLLRGAGVGATTGAGAYAGGVLLPMALRNALIRGVKRGLPGEQPGDRILDIAKYLDKYLDSGTFGTIMGGTSGAGSGLRAGSKLFGTGQNSPTVMKESKNLGTEKTGATNQIIKSIPARKKKINLPIPKELLKDLGLYAGVGAGAGAAFGAGGEPSEFNMTTRGGPKDVGLDTLQGAATGAAVGLGALGGGHLGGKLLRDHNFRKGLKDLQKEYGKDAIPWRKGKDFIARSDIPVDRLEEMGKEVLRQDIRGGPTADITGQGMGALLTALTANALQKSE